MPACIVTDDLIILFPNDTSKRKGDKRMNKIQSSMRMIQDI